MEEELEKGYINNVRLLLNMVKKVNVKKTKETPSDRQTKEAIKVVKRKLYVVKGRIQFSVSKVERLPFYSTSSGRIQYYK